MSAISKPNKAPITNTCMEYESPIFGTSGTNSSPSSSRPQGLIPTPTRTSPLKTLSSTLSSTSSRQNASETRSQHGRAAARRHGSTVGAAARQHGGAAAPQHAVGAHIHAMKKMAYGEKSLRCGATPSPTASIPRYIARSHPSPELITYSSSIALPKLSNEPCNHSVITV